MIFPLFYMSINYSGELEQSRFAVLSLPYAAVWFSFPSVPSGCLKAELSFADLHHGFVHARISIAW
jgi:hypothetical protein